MGRMVLRGMLRVGEAFALPPLREGTQEGSGGTNQKVFNFSFQNKQ